MIAWSIAAARESGAFDHVVVSTDDAEIAAIACAEGAQAPFLRPAELADDHTTMVPVIARAIEAVAAAGLEEASQVCYLYATAPFVQAEDLRRGQAKLETEDCDFVLSVTSYAFPIQRALRLRPGNRVQMVQPEHPLTRSQDLEEAWRDGCKIMGERSVGRVLPPDRVQDIDTLEDWRCAEIMFQALQVPG